MICPFCDKNQFLPIWSGAHCYAIWDNYPVSEGHALIIPYEHNRSYFTDIDTGYFITNVQTDIWTTVNRVVDLIKAKYDPDGFNIGFNELPAAGQTVSHAHIHIIPRYNNDVEDPRGGIRHCVMGKGYY